MSQIDIFGNVSSEGNKSKNTNDQIYITNGTYFLVPNFFNGNEGDSLFDSLRKTIEWKQESMNMYGKRVNFPRLTAWYGEKDKPYSFSGITLQPNSWTENILSIKNKIDPISGVHFNSVLLNLYRNGNDSISWHTDAEPELGLNPVIASVNFGATRLFQLRHKITNEILEMELGHGSLLIMRDELQHFWQHRVPKTTKLVKERINLTFRVLK